MDADSVARLLDPEIRAALELFPFPAIDDNTLPVMRPALAAPGAELSDRVTRSLVHAPGAAGSPDVALRIHRPAGATGALPCLVWMHGGGLVMGVAGMDDSRFDLWCSRHNMMAVSVEYRLAPETPFPGPVEDCYAGLQYVVAHADELGVDTTRVGVGGASAGAGLAAALALMARDRGGPHLSSQFLIYPMIDDRQITESSGWDVPIWPASSNTFGWTSYLGDAKGTDGVSPYAAAARATDLSGLPPAMIVVGGLDGFVDEDIDYARRLNLAGVPVTFHLYPGAPHGFDVFVPNSPPAGQLNLDVESWLNQHYGTAQ
jgi:acetyl esterase/lipase